MRFGCGMLLYNALVAAEELSREGIECMVINSHTVKPLDGKTIIEAAQKRRGSIRGRASSQWRSWLGDSRTLGQNYPVPQEFIGLQDRFGESGTTEELIKACGLGVTHIKDAVKK